MPGYVFVSYSSGDRSYVERLDARFQALGVRTWIDRLGIATGRRWRKEIREAIDGCDALVVVMTPEAERSSWVEEELSRAEARSKPIYPLLLEGEPFFGLATTQYDDVKGGSLPSDQFISTVADTISTSTGNVDGDSPLISRFAGRLMSTFNCGSEPVREIVWLRADQFGAICGQRYMVWRLSTGMQIRALGIDVKGAACSSDCTLIAGHPRSSDKYYADTVVAVHDVTSGREVQRFESDAMIFQWSWHPSDKLLAISGPGFADPARRPRGAVIWNAERGETVGRLAEEIPEEVHSVAWSPDGMLVATGHWWKHGRVRIWDLESGSQVGEFLPKASEKESSTLVSWLAWRELASLLLVGTYSSPYLAPVEFERIEAWNPITSEYLGNLNANVRPDARLSICEKRQLLAQIYGETVVIKNFYHRDSDFDDDLQGEIRLDMADIQATCVAWAPGCECLATGHEDGSVRIWA
jgi:WD40 repeat protein